MDLFQTSRWKVVLMFIFLNKIETFLLCKTNATNLAVETKDFFVSFLFNLLFTLFLAVIVPTLINSDVFQEYQDCHSEIRQVHDQIYSGFNTHNDVKSDIMKPKGRCLIHKAHLCF
jgi:hypothetical protein